MFYVLIILYVALSDLYTFISTEVMIHFFAPIVNEKIKVDLFYFFCPFGISVILQRLDSTQV